MANILLLEPNSVLAVMYTQALQHAEHTVIHARGSQAAIDAADAQTPDVVIIELQLPLHSGLEFLHEFRSYAEWKAVPVILHTSLPPSRFNTLVTEALRHDLGVGAILYKPQTSLQELLRAVRRQLVAA